MDSSPDLSVKLRRGSSDSRDSFYMGFAQGIDSDIEEVTAPQNVPQFPPPEEPPIDLPLPPPVEPEQFTMELEVHPEMDGNVYEQQQNNDNFQEKSIESQPLEEIAEEEPKEEEEQIEVTIPDDDMPLPPSEFLETDIDGPTHVPTSIPLQTSSSIQIDDDEDETNTSVTVIQTKNKTPSSSSSSISSAQNELVIDNSNINLTEIIPPPPLSPTFKAISPPLKPLETDFDTPVSPKFVKSPERVSSPPSKKSSHSSHSRKSPSVSSLKSQHSNKSPPKVIQHKSPPRKLEFYINERQRNADSDSIDSINAIDCKIDDDNRDSSPTDSMPPAPTPPALEPLTLLEKR